MAKTAAVIEVIASSTDIAEVCGGSTVETTSLFILQSGDLRHGRADAARGLFEDVNGALIGLTLGRVA